MELHVNPDVPETDLSALFASPEAAPTEPPETPNPEPTKEADDAPPAVLPDRLDPGDERLEAAEPSAAAEDVPAAAPAQPAAAAPDGVAPAPIEPEPEPPSIAEIVARLAGLTAEQLENLELLDALAHPDLDEGSPELAEVFTPQAASADGVVPERVNVFGKEVLYTEALREMRITPDMVAGPAKRARSARKRLHNALNSLERAEADMQKKLQRTTMKTMRQETGAARKQRDLEMTSQLRQLDLFTDGSQHHRLSLGNTSQIMLVLDDTVLSNDPTMTEDTDLKRVALQIATEFMDHRGALQSATYASKVTRELVLDLFANIDGEHWHLRAAYTNADKLEIRGGATGAALATVKSHSGIPIPGDVEAQARLTYTVKCKRSEIPTLIEGLGFMGQLPVYRMVEAAELLDEGVSLD